MTTIQGDNKKSDSRKKRLWPRSRLLLALVALQALFLLGIAGSYYATGLWGKEIRLETKPVDPHDLFYGDYVTLNYEVSRLTPQQWKGTGSLPKRNDAIFVVLKPDAGGVYHPQAAYGDKPVVSGDEVVLKGRVDYSFDQTISVKYGLERYYVPEGTGKTLENQVGDMVVLVKIAPWGQTRISGLNP